MRDCDRAAKDDEQSLLAEVQARLREIQRAIAGGEPPAQWRARRVEIVEIDELQQCIYQLRSRRAELRM